MFISGNIFQQDNGNLILDSSRYSQLYASRGNVNTMKTKVKILEAKNTIFDEEVKRLSAAFKAFAAEMTDGIENRKERAILCAKTLQEFLDPSVAILRDEQRALKRREKFKKAMKNYVEFIKLYTDGSVQEDGKAGCSIAIAELEEIRVFKIKTEKNVQAELEGLLKAAEMVLSDFKSTDKIVICTDSLANLDSLVSTKAYKKEPLVRRLQDTIIRASKKVKELKFIWVPAHTAIYDNEQADYGAGYAATNLTEKFETIKYTKKTSEELFEQRREKKLKYDPDLDTLDENTTEKQEQKDSKKKVQKQNWKILFTEFQELMTNEQRALKRREKFKKAMKNYVEFIKLYTDGSVQEDGKAGCSIAIAELGEIRVFKIKTEKNVQAELEGLLKAAEMVLSDFKSTDKIVICTDSLANLDSLVSTKAYKKEPLVRRLQDTIIRASKKVKELKFIWVPAHTAIYDNEQADYGAGYAATNLTEKFETIKYTKKTSEELFEQRREKKLKYDPDLDTLDENTTEKQEQKDSKKKVQKQNWKILFTEFQELMTSMKKCKEELTRIQTTTRSDMHSLTEKNLLLEKFSITLNRIESSLDFATDGKLRKSN
ncbi:hypothetical protein QYM36_019402 [Artemia franciscana]|uniref:ribonuclease H n=1 Tax=Artemia franciscana TaxID=6661 RepID=A0AA88KTU1_ARTSF|nr:hypothetical protein QYM36_019402 [Artemia franciscana]